MIELLCFTRPNQIENAAKNLKKYENKKRTQVSKSLKNASNVKIRTELIKHQRTSMAIPRGAGIKNRSPLELS